MFTSGLWLWSDGTSHDDSAGGCICASNRGRSFENVSVLKMKIFLVKSLFSRKICVKCDNVGIQSLQSQLLLYSQYTVAKP